MKDLRSTGSSVASMIAPAPDLISIPEAARRLHVHPDTLYRWARCGEFEPALKIGHGRRWVVSVPRLERYLHDRQEPPAPH